MARSEQTILVQIVADRGEAQAMLAVFRDHGAKIMWREERAIFEGETVHLVRVCPARYPSLFERADVILGRCPEHAGDEGCRAFYDGMHLANPGPMGKHRCVPDAGRFWVDWFAVPSGDRVTSHVYT